MREPESRTLTGVFVRLRALGHRGRAAWLGVFGIPDYDACLAHMRATHPGDTPLGRGEFLAWALERRHAGRGPRCC
jgi:uncharacterized short protein YbdD (DUF466 family)